MLAPFSASPLRVGLAAAEMTKHATNAYLALCVAFANDLAWLSLAPVPTRARSRRSSRRPARLALRAATTRAGVLGSDPDARPGHARELGERCGTPELFAAVVEANERHA